MVRLRKTATGGGIASIMIGARQVGPGHRCFVIAEAGVNHNGDLDQARRLVDAAVEAGADAVKFQSFRAEEVVTPTAPKAAYQLETTPRDESQLEMLRKLELSDEAHEVLWEHCRARGILFLSTPFSEGRADFLERLGVAAFKMPSGELTNLALLAHVARKGRTMIVSTGMANLADIETAQKTLRENGNPPCVLLHCVSAYPAQPAEANLRAMRTMSDAFKVPIGYSDHTPGIDVTLAAVALGACVIEKHLTLDRTLPGPDHRASIEPAHFSTLVKGIRTVEAALGHGRKEPTLSEAGTAATARRSLVTARAIPAGSVFQEAWIVIRRPGTGLPPSALPRVLASVAARDIPKGAVLIPEMIRDLVMEVAP